MTWDEELRGLGPSTCGKATRREIEEVVSSNPVAPLLQESASGPSGSSTQTRLQNVRKALMEMPYVAEYMTDTGEAAALRSGFDGGRDNPPSSLPVIRDDSPVSPPLLRLMYRLTQLLSE